MNTISKTRVFKEFINSNLGKDVLKMINPQVINDYLVNPIWYEHFVKIFKNYKYPLSKAVYEYSNNGSVQVINYADPEDSSKKIFILQAYLPSFILKNVGNLPYVSYVNIAPRAKYIRNKISNEIESLKISERDLYAFLQIATTNIILTSNKSDLKKNDKFIKLSVELYSGILSRCINRTYPLSADRNNIIILNYFTNLFALQTMFEFNEEKSILLASQMKNIDKGIISTIKNNSLKMKSIDDFINIVENEFEFLRKGSLIYRNLMLMYNKMYGQNSVFAIEHFFSFLSMVQTSSLRIGMYNDAQLDQLAKMYIPDIEKILLSYI